MMLRLLADSILSLEQGMMILLFSSHVMK